MQTGTQVEFMEDVCGQTNQEIYRAALRAYENSGFREIPIEEKILERNVESCGPEEHHAMENVYVLSPESGALSGEQSDDDYLFEDISDTDFSNKENEVNEARSETSFAGSSDSVACGNVIAIASSFGSGVKTSRNDMLRAWGLMELKTGGSDQKFGSMEVEPFGSIRTAVMSGLQQKWHLQWKKSWSSIQTEEEGFHVEVHECMRRGTLTAKLFKRFYPIVAYMVLIYFIETS